jgi:hypothetical protein
MNKEQHWPFPFIHPIEKDRSLGCYNAHGSLWLLHIQGPQRSLYRQQSVPITLCRSSKHTWKPACFLRLISTILALATFSSCLFQVLHMDHPQVRAFPWPFPLPGISSWLPSSPILGFVLMTPSIHAIMTTPAILSSSASSLLTVLTFYIMYSFNDLLTSHFPTMCVLWDFRNFAMPCT